MAKRRPLRQLPPELRAQLDRLLNDDKHTITEITEHLRGLGAEVSRSAVHRYSQHHEQIAADIRAARHMAQAVGAELANVDGDAGRLVIESLQALLLRARMQLADEDELCADEVGKLARAAKDLQQALRANVDSTIKAKEQALREAVAAVEQSADADGLSEEVVNIIRTRILGVRKEAA